MLLWSIGARVLLVVAVIIQQRRSGERAVGLPTFIVYGTADMPNIKGSSQRTHAAIAGSHLEVYDGAPHGLFLTHRERFNRDLLAFAQR